jgi:hypothetical protein
MKKLFSILLLVLLYSRIKLERDRLSFFYIYIFIMMKKIFILMQNITNEIIFNFNVINDYKGF